MPAIRFSVSPPPPPIPPGDNSPEPAPAQPVRSALAHPELSLEATFGLIFQSHERRFDEQDALPPQTTHQPALPHSASDLTLSKRPSRPTRPPRPTSTALQGAQAYLDATVKPSTMRQKDVEAWVEDSLHAQAAYGSTSSSPLDPATPFNRRRSTMSSSGEWPPLDQGDKTSPEGEKLHREKSSSFSSSTRKRWANSDFVNWLKSPALPGSAPRSRSTSQATEPSEEEQAAASHSRWSTSSRRRLLGLSDSSQHALLLHNTPPTYRSVLTGFHRRFYSTDTNDNSSDSSWTSFGCIDGMRRADASTNAAKVAGKNKADEAEVDNEVQVSPMKEALKKCARGLAMPVKTQESDMPCVHPHR